MGKHINHPKDHSGFNQYIYNGYRVNKTSYFLYEVSIDKYWSNGYSSLGNRYFKSDKLLKFKNPSKVKYFNDYSIRKNITLIGVPITFIQENKLKLYERTR